MAGVQILLRCYQLLRGVCTGAHAPALPLGTRAVFTHVVMVLWIPLVFLSGGALACQVCAAAAFAKRKAAF